MVKLARIFGQIKPFKALVLGDFLLDSYTTGRVKRISPEAPVPVMEVLSQESRPGGAGNVVLNLVALGASVYSVGRIGSDQGGRQLKEALSLSNTDALLIEPNYKTPVKNRLIAESQQLLRLDFETISPLDRALEDHLIEQLPALISQVDVVALSDYGKGFLTHRLISFVINYAKEKKIPTLVDPKGLDFTKYKGASLIKPNLSESYAAAKCPIAAPLDEVAAILRPLADTLVITRSEAGISVFNQEGIRSDFPVRSKEVKDVTGAGDTVLAILALGLASQLEIGTIIELANMAASLSIERLGCVQITLSELAKRLLETDCDSKIFDESHTFALHQVLKDKCYNLLVLEPNQGLTRALFRAIRTLANKEEQELIIYVPNGSPDDEFIHLLSSLHEVDTIILQTESLKNLWCAIHPAEIFELKGDELKRVDQGKMLLDSLLKWSSIDAH